MTKLTDNKDMVKYAVAYIRRSTEEQSTFSIGSQIEYCKREATARGYTLPDENIFIDNGFSAKTANRPALIKMLALCKKKNQNIHALIIYKIDRLARSTTDYLGIRKLLADEAIQIVSCTEPAEDSPAGQFIETILAATAQYDNMVKSERVKANMMYRFKSGLPNGKAKIGYLNQRTPDGKSIITKDPETFDKLQRAWLEMEKGTHSLNSIAQLLNGLGVKSKRGDKRFELTRQQVSRIFSDKAYCGYVTSRKYKTEVKSSQIPQMITEDTFYKVRAILLGRNKSPSVYQRIRPEFALRGFLLCPRCFQPMRAGFSKGRYKYYGYYFCQSHSTPALSIDKIDDALIKILRDLTPDPLLKKIFIEDVKKKWSQKYLDFNSQQVGVEESIKELVEEKHLIGKKNRQGVYSDEFTKEALERIDLEIMAKKTILSESRLAQIDIEVVIAFMNGFLEDLGKVYMEAKNIELKRMLIGSIFPKKLVFSNSNLEPLELSPAFQVLKAIATKPYSLSGLNDVQLEPIIAEFNRLRMAFAIC